MSSEKGKQGEAPPPKQNYAAVARQPVPSRPPQGQLLPGLGNTAAAPAVATPPQRTASAPPEQSNLLQSSKVPAFIPDKSTGGARPVGQQPGPRFNGPPGGQPPQPPQPGAGGAIPPQNRQPLQYPQFQNYPRGAAPFTPGQGGQFVPAAHGVAPPYSFGVPAFPFQPAPPPFKAPFNPQFPGEGAAAAPVGGTVVPAATTASPSSAAVPVGGAGGAGGTGTGGAGAAPSPAVKAPARKPLQFVNPATGEPVEIKPTSTTPLKIAPAFEPTKTPNPAQTAPAQSSDAAAAKTEPVSKPGRWKPPGDIVEGESAKKEEPPKVEAAAVAPTPVKTEPETAPVVSADVAAPEQKAETQHQEERKQEQQVQEEPARVVVPPAEKEEKKKEEKKKEEKADEKKPVVDDWENVNTAELGREVEERVAAAIKVEEKPAEEETPKKIRYDDVSYNPAAEHAGKKKYTKDFLMQFKPLYTVKPQDLRETLEIVENSGARQEESRDHSKDGNRSDDRGSNQRGNRRDRQNQQGNMNFRAAEQWEKGREGGQGRFPGGKGGGGGGGGRDRFGKRDNKPQGPPVEPLLQTENGWKREKVRSKRNSLKS